MGKLNTLVTTMDKKLFGLMFMMILLVGTVSAWDWSLDNDFNITEDMKTITYYDKPFIFGDNTELATIELKTELKEKVGIGYVKVFEYEITNSYEAVDKMIGDMN